MGNDLPDFQSQVIGAGLEATSFRSGLDADKPASPAAGDIWLARDTYYLYVCNTAGSWEKVAKLYLPLAGGTLTGDLLMSDGALGGIFKAIDTDVLYISGGPDYNSARLCLWGKSHATTPGKIALITPNAALGYVDRLAISGAVDVAVLSLASVTVTGLKLSGALDFNSQAINNVLISQTQPVGQALDTIYHNTSGKIRVVSVSVYCGVLKSATSVTGNSLVFAYCENANPPTIQVGKIGVYITFDGLTTIGQTYTYDSITFIVPPNYYYKLTTSKANDGITPVLTSWTEWDLL